MRYIFKSSPSPEIGDSKLITKFLWFPKIKLNNNGDSELRWLEKASYKIYYTNDKYCTDGESAFTCYGWVEELRWENN